MLQLEGEGGGARPGITAQAVSAVMRARGGPALLYAETAVILQLPAVAASSSQYFDPAATD